jgi:hypothetical protein
MSVTIDGSAGVTTNTGAVYNGLQTTTAVASTSGTAILFTSIPLWVKRITVMFNGVSTSGTSVVQIQIGSGSVTTSGYVCVASNLGAASLSSAAITSGIAAVQAMAAAYTLQGSLRFENITGNTWAASGAFAFTGATAISVTAGSIALSGTLDRVNITTVGGTDTFDAGTINLIYE